MKTAKIKPKITALLAELNTGLWEKEQAVALTLLAAAAGESVFMLGMPGVAKSLIARRLKSAFAGARVFEYLMSRFSTPDELFGPVSISKLKDEDKYVRAVENYLPTAQIVFLDEIWRAGPAIQNALLTVINEKIYRNGDTDIKLPLKALISASNGLPARGEGLEALWDRFLLRLEVDGIKDEGKFQEMICASLSDADSVSVKNKITDGEYSAWQPLIDTVTIPQNVLTIILVLKNAYFREYNEKEDDEKKHIYISDRRWRKIIRLLRTAAFLNDRTTVNIGDCFLLQYCLWNDKEEIAVIKKMVNDAITGNAYITAQEFKEFRARLAEFSKEIADETSKITDTRKKVFVSLYGYYAVKISDEESLYIQKENFESLREQEISINLYARSDITNAYLEANRSSGIYKKGEGGYINPVKEKKVQLDFIIRNPKPAKVKKGLDDLTVFVDGVSYPLVTSIKGDRRKKTRKASQSKENLWNRRINTFKEYLEELSTRLETCIKNDAKEVRGNLFVFNDEAKFVEAHIALSRREIEKIEVEIMEIQNHYQKLEDAEFIL